MVTARLHSALALLALASILAGSPAAASVVQAADGWHVDYAIDIWNGTSNGADITSVFIFEADGARLGVSGGYALSGHGTTTLAHVSGFAPTKTLIAGIGRGVAGVGDGKDHIYLVENDGFATAAVGLRWSEIFPGGPAGRMRHDDFVALLGQADSGDAAALETVTRFAVNDAAAAWFDTVADRFAVTEFSVGGPPIGGRAPEPATAALVLAALAGIRAARHAAGRHPRPDAGA